MKPEPSWDRWKSGFLILPNGSIKSSTYPLNEGLSVIVCLAPFVRQDVAAWVRKVAVFCLQSFGFGRHQDSAYPFQEHLDRCPEPAASWEPRHGALIHSPDSAIRTVDGFDSNPHTTACCSSAPELRPPELDLESLELSSKKMGRLRFELRTSRLKAGCSTAELATLAPRGESKIITRTTPAP